MNRIGDLFGTPWTAGIGLPGPQNGQQMVDRMIREIVKAVIAQTMSQSAANPLAQTGAGALPIMDNPFGSASPCSGASLFQGAPDLSPAGIGTLPNILPA